MIEQNTDHWQRYCCQKKTIALSQTQIDTDLNVMKFLLQKIKTNFKDTVDIPIAAAITDENGVIITWSENESIKSHDPTAHAEINTIRAIGQIKKNHRHTNMTIYTTHEPCPMCFFAILQARIKRIVFGSFDEKIGILCKHEFQNTHQKTNHHFTWTAGVMKHECADVLKLFFHHKRTQ